MFSFDLPDHLIRQSPLHERSSSRLMTVSRSTYSVNHLDHFMDISNLLTENDVLFINNTRVIPARLFAKKPTGAKVEIMIERIIDDQHLLALVKCNSRLSEGSTFNLDENNSFIIESSGEISQLKLRGDRPLIDLVFQYGQAPLPPYISRQPDALDTERYQTIYANHPGAVAAPTAGLHFCESLLKKLKLKNVQIVPITLHVGAGTYKPVKADQTELHSEIYEVNEAAATAWQQAKKQKKRIIAVGTTTVRALESWLQQQDQVPGTYATNLWIKPGFTFKAIDGLITNFHLPNSSLLSLVSALTSNELMKQAYETAIAENYHFFSYGDAMFIYP